MLTEPKFKRGNLVRVLVGHVVWGGGKGAQDILPENVGRLAIIEYVYWEAYGFMFPQTEECRLSHIDDYSIIFLDDGNSFAWKHTKELAFLEEGGEHLFQIAKNPHFKEYKQKILDKYEKDSAKTVED